MTNVKPTNEKLRDRSLRILAEETGLDAGSAADLMRRADNDLRAAIVMNRTKTDLEMARQALAKYNFVIERAVKSFSGSKE